MPASGYAKDLGFKSLGASIVFSVLYVPLFGWFVRQSFVRPTYVHFVLAFFCAIRITAFTMRTVLIASEAASYNMPMFIADEVLSTVGFFGLLYSAYTLVLDRISVSEIQPPSGIFHQVLRNKHLFRLGLAAAVAVGIAGISLTKGSNGFTSKGSALRKTSIIIFLVLTVLQAIQTAILTRMDIKASVYTKHQNDVVGLKYGCFLLCAITSLLLMREVFTAAIMGNLLKQHQEDLWYLFVVLPEIMSVVLYSLPGLVPSRSELPTERIAYSSIFRRSLTETV